MNLDTLRQTYEKNEDQNYHSDNLLLLATAFGTDNERREAARQAQSRNSETAPPYDMPRHVRESINQYYYRHLAKGNTND